MSLLEQHLDQARQVSIPSVHANSWGGFLRYLLHRNRGYGQRKVLNLLNELVELGCLAWIVDLHYLRSLILIPLAHVTINYIQEYHWQLTRHAPRSWLERRLNPLDLAFWGVSVLLLGSLGLALDRATGSDPLILLIFAMRAAQALIQVGLAPWVVRATAFRRIRPNVPFIWGSSIFAWLGSAVAMVLPIGIYYALLVPGLFNGVRILQEFSFWRSVRGESHRSRLLPRFPKKQPEHTGEIRPLLAAVAVHLSLLLFASYRLQPYLGLGGVFVPFFLLAFFDRILTRPLRSLAVDLLRMERREHELLKSGYMNRILVLSLMMIAVMALWVGPGSGRSTVFSFFVASTFCQLFVNNALIFGKRVRDSEGLWAYLSLPLLAVLLIPGRTSILFFSWIGVVWACWGWIRVSRSRRNALAFPNRIGFEWRPVLPLWSRFNERVTELGLRLHSLDRRRKILEFHEPSQWEILQNEFPLNIRNRFAVESVPEREDFPVPREATLVYCDAFGFWKPSYGGRRLTSEESGFLHQVAQEWKRYPFLLGKKRSFKGERRDGSRLRGGPLSSGNRELWLCP